MEEKTRQREWRAGVRAATRLARELWRNVPPRDRLVLGVAMLLMALAGTMNTAIPLLLGRLVDGVSRHAQSGGSAEAYLHAGFCLLGIGLACLVREAFHVSRRLLVENSNARLERDLTVRVMSHLFQRDVERLAQERVGTLHGRLHRNVGAYVRLIKLAFLDFFPTLFLGAFALAAAFAKDARMGLVMAGVIPIAVLIAVKQIFSQQRIRLELLRSVEAMDGTIVEQLNGIDYVRAANTHELEVARVEAAAEGRRLKEMRHHVVMAFFGSVKSLNEAFFHIIVLAFAIHLAVSGSVSSGDVLAFSMLFANVMSPLHDLHRILDESHDCGLRVRNLLDLLREPLDRSFATPPGAAPRLARDVPVFACKDLCVEYANRNGERSVALRGVTMEIHRGETVGLVGRSGSGKTTLVKVLLRLTHPCGGHVWLGGEPIERVSREEIGRLVGYAGQFPFLFAGTVEENITYGLKGSRSEEIHEAAHLASIAEEVLAMPGSYQAAVSEGGRNLSGGQRQRLALARVFLKSPPILVLDEATSALDNITDRKVQEALAAARDGRTIILVSHRLSSLRTADRIFVFEGSRVIETGDFDDLRRRDGVFAELVRCAEREEQPLVAAR